MKMDYVEAGGYAFYGWNLGPITYIAEGPVKHPRRYRERTLIVGPLSVSVGTGVALDYGFQHACETRRMRGRWLRRGNPWPAVLLAYEGPER